MQSNLYIIFRKDVKSYFFSRSQSREKEKVNFTFEEWRCIYSKDIPVLKGHVITLLGYPFFLGGQSYDLDSIITMKKKDSTVKQLTQRKTSYKKPALSTSLFVPYVVPYAKGPSSFLFLFVTMLAAFYNYNHKDNKFLLIFYLNLPLIYA